MQESRLFKIVYYLLKNKKATAAELAGEFEVSVRTIYRDIERLSGNKIPIYCTKGRGGGIFLLDGYVLDKQLISKEEQKMILSSIQSFSSLMPNEENKLNTKLSAIFKENTIDWIQIDFSKWGNCSLGNEKINLIKKSILEKNLLEFKYINSKAQEKIRCVKPLRVYFKFKSWYLQAYCMEKEDFRIFKLNRMSNIKILCEKFDEDYILPNIEDYNQDMNCLDYVKLLFDKELSYRVYDEFDIECIKYVDDSFISVEVKIIEDEWLYGYLLSFCGGVKIISPEHIKNKFRKYIKNMYKKYCEN